MTTQAKTELTYRDAMNKLQEIVERLRETDDIDVDVLVKDVTKAKELIEFCGGKIQKAELQIQRIVGQLREDGNEQELDSDSPSAEAEESRPPQSDEILF